MRISRRLVFAVLVGTALAASASAQSKPPGVMYRSPSGTILRLMLDETSHVAEVSVGQIMLPPNPDSGGFSRGAIVKRDARSRIVWKREP